MTVLKQLHSDDHVLELGLPKNNETTRATVVAVIYDEITNRYLCQYWEEYDGLTCLLSGGIDNCESAITALRREMTEETGYIEYQILGQLGGQIMTHYTKAKTGENFLKIITPILVNLKSTVSLGMQLEDDEKFINLFRKSETIFKLMDAYEVKTGSLLNDHKTILRRGEEWINSRHDTAKQN